MTGSLPPIKIHVLDPDENGDDVALTDVGVVTLDGERHLFLSPQSFYSAVRQVSAAMPDLPIEQVERLVRDHCDFKDFDELLASPAEPAPPVDQPPSSLEAPAAPARVGAGRAKNWAVAAALLPSLVGAWALGHYTGSNEAPTAANTPAARAGDSSFADKNLGPEPFTARDFTAFSDAGKIDCNPIDNLEAECTDSDGMVMATKAATGPDSTIFTFSYGSEGLVLRIFGDAKYAETWSQQDASKQLYPNMVRSGRYVLWGTDKARIAEYLELLNTSSARRTLGFADPLPPRLAALTLGTLGLDESDVQAILVAPQGSAGDGPVQIAARAVLGVGDGMRPAEPGADDIVAIAAGLDGPPGSDNGSVPRGGGGVVQIVSDPVPAKVDSSNEPPEPTAPKPIATSDPQPTDGGQTKPPDQEKPAPLPDPAPKPEDPKPEQPTKPVEPEEPVTAPIDPSPQVTEPPAPPQEPDPAEPLPPAVDGGAPVGETPDAGEQPPAGGAADDGEDQEDGGELLVLPQAWIAPAA
ncbi:hypothetical protein G3I60_05450 [Streptomyces sp. SID13666]|uniref:hypothetical protein n=1 Tax=Streptomyces sp. SID13666 TaxID=2706054 RepID=UPI0013C11E8A|nr:hypothetical protein [Streptomyces sp. SID13666]NEA53616.1 hypothetical protein [Streptomyces sp. SID13666]